MRTEDDLRSALRLLERETPSAETVLRRVTERTGAGRAGHGRPPGRRLMAGAAAAAAVIAIAVAAALVATLPQGHGRASPQDALRSVPRYYMALVPAGPGSYVAQYAVVRDTVTGRTLASVRPPRPYLTFIGLTGAADDRTFVLTAQSTLSGSLTSRNKFYYARFNPADDAVTMTPLALPGLPFSNNLNGAALSPDGTRLAVASQNGAAQIAVYSLPSGAVRVWKSTANVSALVFVSYPADLLSWSRHGILAFGWNGSPGLIVRHGQITRDKNLESPYGEYLLNTNGPGGGLLADSRQPLCPPSQAFPLGYPGYLTPDGTKIIMPLAHPVKPGQRPNTFSQVPWTPGHSRVFPQLEEFSATTGKAIGVIYTSPSPITYTSRNPLVGGYGVFWSNASGSVLVLDSPVRPGQRAPDTFGVVSGTTFTPIPGAPSPVNSTLAF